MELPGIYDEKDGEEKRQRTKQISPKGRLATNVHLLLQMMGCDEAKALPMPPRNILTESLNETESAITTKTGNDKISSVYKNGSDSK